MQEACILLLTNWFFVSPLDTGPNVTKVLNGEKPGKNLKNVLTNNNKTNAKNATNNAKNVDKKREGSNSRKNSLTGSNSSREPSKSRGNSKSPAKRISRQNSKEETSPKQNGGDLLSNGVDTTPKSEFITYNLQYVH